MEINKKILLMPMIISVVMAVVQIYALIMTDSPYIGRVSGISILLVLVWIAFFAVSNKESISFTIKPDAVFAIVITGLLSFLIGIVFSVFVWGKGYLSLSPIARINNGVQHVDTLFHSAIAESFGRSIVPSALVNEERGITYHTFSHFLLYTIERATSMPAFIIYNHIYPILFLPLYVFSQIVSIKCAKKYFTKSWDMYLTDVLIIGIYNIGLFTDSLASDCGIWKSSYVCSESFLIANTLAFFFYSSLLQYLQKDIKNKALKFVFIILGIPAMIFSLSWAKISVGLLFTVSIMYYILRKYWRSLKSWGVEILYGMVFLLGIYLFNRGEGTGDGIKNAFQLFAFKDYCNGIQGLIGHYLILFSMGGVFIFFELIANKYCLKDLKDGKMLWIEEVFVVCIVGFLPGFMIKINGGSAVYFSYAAGTLSLIMLCGGNSIENVMETYGRRRIRALSLFLFLWCTCIGINDSISIVKEHKMIIKDNNSGFYFELMKLREMVNGEPERYIFYLDEDAKAMQLFQTPLEAIYIHPGLTGVGVINASYCRDGKYFMFDGTEIFRYGLKNVDNEKLTYREALIKAKEMGKSYVIHASLEGYKVDELGNNKPLMDD